MTQINSELLTVLPFLFTGLAKKCMIRKEKNNDYKKLMKISDILGSQVSHFQNIYIQLWLDFNRFDLFFSHPNFHFLAARLSSSTSVLRIRVPWCAHHFFTNWKAKLETGQCLWDSGRWLGKPKNTDTKEATGWWYDCWVYIKYPTQKRTITIAYWNNEW